MNIIIKDENKFSQIKNDILLAGFESLHVLADFDRTLTYGLVDGKKSSSLISLLESSCQLGCDYTEKAEALFNKYHPIEIDLSIPLLERKDAMFRWWHEIYDLLISFKLKQSDLEEAIKKSNLKLREGVSDLLKSLNDKNIPLIIFSASGCGEMIEIFLKENNCNYPNIFYIINNFNWDDSGQAVSIKEPVIHSLNKNETVLSSFPKTLEVISARKNVLLLGDSVSDLGMVNGFDVDNLLTIGFLNFGIEENRDTYVNNFHAVIEGDGDFSFVLDIFR